MIPQSVECVISSAGVLMVQGQGGRSMCGGGGGALQDEEVCNWFPIFVEWPGKSNFQKFEIQCLRVNIHGEESLYR